MANVIHGAQLDDFLNGSGDGIAGFVTLENFDFAALGVSGVTIELF